jgi:hypothetical protein
MSMPAPGDYEHMPQHGTRRQLVSTLRRMRLDDGSENREKIRPGPGDVY